MVDNATPHGEAEVTDMPKNDEIAGEIRVSDVKPFMKDPQKFTYSYFDIETTGRLWNDEVIELGFLFDGVTTVFQRVDTPSGQASVDSSDVQKTTDQPVEVIEVDSEKELLERASSLVGEQHSATDGNTIFVAYNGQHYKGGFDLGFLRMRAEQYQMSHPLKGVRFLDPFEAVCFKDRINTTQPSIRGNPDIGTLSKDQLREFAEYWDIPIPESPDGEFVRNPKNGQFVEEFPDHLGMKRALKEHIAQYSTPEMVRQFAEEELSHPFYENRASVGLPMRSNNGLDEVYDMITEGETPDVVEADPWEDSGKVLDAWADGNVRDIVLHNVADLHQTERIMEMVVRQLDPNRLRPDWL